jgi:hypothetical protein
MKKSELLGLTVALAGGIVSVMPQTAAATECGSVTVAGDVATCTVASGGYLQESFNFAGSKGVHTTYDNQTGYFAACSYHVTGGKSFGMTTETSTMTIRGSTGSTATSGTGCS